MQITPYTEGEVFKWVPTPYMLIRKAPLSSQAELQVYFLMLHLVSMKNAAPNALSCETTEGDTKGLEVDVSEPTADIIESSEITMNKAAKNNKTDTTQ